MRRPRRLRRMSADDPRRQLRGAVFRGDATVVVAVLERIEPRDCLQLGGDGLLVALDHDADGAVALATRWAAALRERSWDGDTELAAQLAARLGLAPTPMLRALPVDLDQLADVLEGDLITGGGRVDLQTGEVWPQSAIDDPDQMREHSDDELDPRRWLPVESAGSRPGYRDMQEFIAALPEAGDRDRLTVAIQGRGAFRRFRDVLSRWPEQFARWQAFGDERQRGRARAWLAEAGFRPVSGMPSSP